MEHEFWRRNTLPLDQIMDRCQAQAQARWEEMDRRPTPILEKEFDSLVM